MAAGLALDTENFKSFQKSLDQAVEQQALIHPVVNELQVDVWQQPSKIDLSLLQSIDQLAPFGAGNPPIVMATKGMRLLNATPIGKTKEHLQLVVEDAQGQASKILWWQAAGLPQPEGLFDLAFSARASTYKGQPQVQLEWLDFRPVEAESLSLTTRKSKVITHFDYRKSSTRDFVLRDIVSKYQPLVFSEGRDIISHPGKTRQGLVSCDSLVMLTLPPSQSVLDQIVSTVQPERIFWFGAEPAADEAEYLLKTCAQLIKQGLAQNQSTFEVEAIASQLATSMELITLIIYWLAARGDISILEETVYSIKLKAGGTVDKRQQEEFKKKIQKALAETQAFRRYALRCDPSTLTDH